MTSFISLKVHLRANDDDALFIVMCCSKCQCRVGQGDRRNEQDINILKVRSASHRGYCMQMHRGGAAVPNPCPRKPSLFMFKSQRYINTTTYSRCSAPCNKGKVGSRPSSPLRNRFKDMSVSVCCNVAAFQRRKRILSGEGSRVFEHWKMKQNTLPLFIQV